MLMPEMDAIVERSYVVVGSPDEVDAHLREAAKNLNVGHLIPQFATMNKDLTKYNTLLFAEQVMRQLRELFSDWEDRWWPHPMDHSTRAPSSELQPTPLAAP